MLDRTRLVIIVFKSGLGEKMGTELSNKNKLTPTIKYSSVLGKYPFGYFGKSTVIHQPL